MLLDKDSDVTAAGCPDEAQQSPSECPSIDGFNITSFTPSFEICPGPRKRLNAPGSESSASTSEVPLESKIPPSNRMMSLLEGLNEPGDSGNPPEEPPWLDRQLFDRGREFYKHYLFCLSFSDLLSLILMLSNDRPRQVLIYTGQSDTPAKALKRYFSTLLHVNTWYKGDIWNPEDEAHKDILTVRSVHNKLSRLCNSSEENEKVTNVQVSDKGHQEPVCPLYTAIKQDVDPYVEAKLNLSSTDSPRHYISQFDMSMTQYFFMGLLLAHPEKLGAAAATDEEFAGLVHFWRGIGWLLGIDDEYNFCSGSVAETRSLCLEVEKLLELPFLAEVDWNSEHMATSLVSGVHFIIPNLSFPTMFRYLAHTMGIAVPAFVKRMSYYHCFHYWVMRIIFGFLVFFPDVTKLLSSKFNQVVTQLRGKKIVCPKATITLTKNYS